MTSATEAIVEVDGHRVRLTTLDRPMWPELRFTKGQLIDYYARVGPHLLPHIAGRPLTLRRFPEGMDGPDFFQTRCPPRPSWVRTQRMWTFRSGKDVEAPVIDDLAGLLWAANLAAVELHPYLAMAESLDRPTEVVFDLDPGEPAGLIEACEVAMLVRDVLDDLGLGSAVKVSGAKGVHVHVPVSDVSFEETKAFARAVAALVARAHPNRVVDRMARSLRSGRVFIDWSQNDAGKSTVAPYSMRAGSYPSIAMPMPWRTLRDAIATRSELQLRITPLEALRRAPTDEDSFGEVVGQMQTLPMLGRDP
jgi:bifunctional non-homologous end joining protein LigD